MKEEENSGGPIVRTRDISAAIRREAKATLGWEKSGLGDRHWPIGK